MQFVEYTDEKEIHDRQDQLKVLSDLYNQTRETKHALLDCGLFRINECNNIHESLHDTELLITEKMESTFNRLLELKRKE